MARPWVMGGEDLVRVGLQRDGPAPPLCLLPSPIQTAPAPPSLRQGTATDLSGEPLMSQMCILGDFGRQNLTRRPNGGHSQQPEEFQEAGLVDRGYSPAPAAARAGSPCHGASACARGLSDTEELAPTLLPGVDMHEHLCYGHSLSLFQQQVSPLLCTPKPGRGGLDELQRCSLTLRAVAHHPGAAGSGSLWLPWDRSGVRSPSGETREQRGGRGRGA